MEGRQEEAETFALREVQAFLRRHLEGSTLAPSFGGIRADLAEGSPEELGQSRLDELEAFWDARAEEEDNGVDPDVRDLALAIAGARYREIGGDFDGKTGSAQFHQRRYCDEQIERARMRLFGKTLPYTAGGDFFRLRRFREL